MTDKILATERLARFERFGSVLGLERERELLRRLGNPQDALKVVHVAGTNGKGSVCRYIYEVLLANGYTAGIFTSPFLTDFRDHLEFCGERISAEELEQVTARVLAEADGMVGEGFDTPTKFEILTAVAFFWFAEKAPDFVVLEVGLGGREDSTNVVSRPLVSVITSISMDHMQQLGDTIEKIAAEKAGIIKPGCPVVCGARGEAKRVIAREAYRLGAPLLDTERIKVRVFEKDALGSRLMASIRGVRYEDIRLSMGGAHQVDNAVVALAAIEVLRKDCLTSFSLDRVREGMQRARVPGRFEILSEEPLVLIDGAHNEAGAEALAKAAEELLAGKRILLLSGIQADKDAPAILRAFFRFADGMILTRSSNPNALDPEAFRALAADLLAQSGKSAADFQLEAEAKPLAALSRARDCLHGYDCLLIAGSLYLLGDYMRAGAFTF
ncbi:MAG: bifunctional folylpolyglutamate synthase/dihydrofolate synthase [Clostridiales Family XIII bacterium]|jgi:dihydrofolate synthase/folylpolyglutamate synthase|nr:bifunctional folylpolyglutamate synthase/dihydrofolate synthase [Clostridiales Family XIII bacterium]